MNAGVTTDALPEAFWLADGDGFRATEATRGPWSVDHQHGGPPSALLARALELGVASSSPSSSAPMRAARVTVAFHRPIPIVERYSVAFEVVRDGKKVRVARAQLVDSAGRAVASAEALFIRRADVGVQATPDAAPPRAPRACAPYHFPFFLKRVGYDSAMEGRLLGGTFGSGKMAMWLRMRIPVVPGEAPSPLQRVMCAADSGNGVSVGLDLKEYTFVPPDLTVVLTRELEGEWVCLDATTRFGGDGIGLADTALLDEQGLVGRGLQPLIVERRAGR